LNFSTKADTAVPTKHKFELSLIGVYGSYL